MHTRVFSISTVILYIFMSLFIGSEYDFLDYDFIYFSEKEKVVDFIYKDDKPYAIIAEAMGEHSAFILTEDTSFYTFCEIESLEELFCDENDGAYIGILSNQKAGTLTVDGEKTYPAYYFVSIKVYGKE